MEKFEYLPIKCRTKRASDLFKKLQQSVTPSSLAAKLTSGNENKKPLKSKV
jgi:hypothetical protein